MNCNFKQEKKIEFISKYAKKKKEWEKYFNKIWTKLSVGQQHKMYEDALGKETADFCFRSNMVWSEKLEKWVEGGVISKVPQSAIHITDKRKLYDYMITKYNLPKLDRVVGAKLG